MEYGGPAGATFQALKALGVRIAIDDFGTGYSSLSALKRFPVDVLKIDRSFIDGLPDDVDDQAITATIIAMASTLRLALVAEGVETPAQHAFLLEKGCRVGQGYLFSKPLAAEACLQWLLQALRPVRA